MNSITNTMPANRIGGTTPLNRPLMQRRNFLQSVAALTAGVVFPVGIRAQQTSRSANERLGIGAIGLRYQGSVITQKAQEHGNIVALCDVDRHVREQARAAFGSTPTIFEDYRDLLQRKDVDVVLIGTPDHWHSKMVIDACRAGKDVYCEKPLTLTIDEGKKIRDVVKSSGQVLQVGSWQRSDHRFRLAVEMVRSGRIGELKTVEVILGKNEIGGPFEIRQPPGNLNWNLWQGQTPDVPYIEQRSHYTFRWWQEYSGGQMTDWGAHHIDIAHWGIGSEPVFIEGTAKYPNVTNGYNVPIDFFVTYGFQNGVELTVGDTGRNGITFNGTEGRIFVNRGTLDGIAIDQLKDNPLPRDRFSLYNFDNLDRPERVGKLDAIVNHMGNFFDCVRSRRSPISEIECQHRSVTTCHLGNIAMKLGRPVQWDPTTETFGDDRAANALLTRDQRRGFEVG